MSVKIGILGAGNIANTFAKNSVYVNDAEIYAVASRDIAKSKDFADKYGIKTAYGSYDELYKDENVDIIYIATPHNFHYEQAKVCLLNGKAVLCEKPSFLNTKEATEIIELAKEKNLLLMEAMWTRFLPPVNTAKEWIKDGKIGDLKLLKADFGFIAKEEPTGRMFNPDLAGGALYDIGVYTYSFVSYLADSKIKQHKSIVMPAFTGVDETTASIIEYENKAVAQITCSIRAGLSSDAVIYGTEGSIKVEKFWCATKAYLYDKAGNLVDSFDSGYKDEHPDLYEGFKYQIQHAVDLYKNGKTESPVASFDYILAASKYYEDCLG